VRFVDKEREGELTMDFIISQLGSLKTSCAAKVSETDPSRHICYDDMIACEAAAGILYAVMEAGARTSAEALDVIHDYSAQAKQYQRLYDRHVLAGKPYTKDGVWHCPACKRRTTFKHSYCHICGKRLDWR